jgi:tRNA (mo5U34)-methyltransferase
VHVDTEWRSDWKWSRVAPHLDLKGKRILDVGCGNGYYMWRMLGAGADSVIGVDPNWLFFCQFQAVQRYLSEPKAWHLPFRSKTCRRTWKASTPCFPWACSTTVARRSSICWR